jgi:hypothetical protein
MEFEKQKAFNIVLRFSRRFILGQVGSFYRHSIEIIASFCHAEDRSVDIVFTCNRWSIGRHCKPGLS